MFCPQCKSKNPENSKYCINCGYDFSELRTSAGRAHSGNSIDNLKTIDQSDTYAENLKVGLVFANRYEILSEGIKGGMGVVCKCRDKKLGKIKALKVIHPKLLRSEQAIQRFRQEVSISQDFQHANIVKVYDLDEFSGIEFFTMEWVEGKSLRDVIVERKKESRPFTVEEAYKVISQLADALQYAHTYTIHRDIKPENILVNESKGGFQIKLTDFGIAKMLTTSQFTSTSLQMGTPYYMAPEQRVDSAHVDKRADIYAMGVVLFELLTLENTIGLEMPSEINQDLPKEIDQVIKRAIATKPENRYGEIRQLSDGLGNLVQTWKQRTDQERKRAEELRKKEEERLKKEAEETERKKKEEERREKEEEERKHKIQSLFDEGKILLYNNKLDNAIKTFEKLLEMDSRNEEGRELLDRAKSEKRRLEESRRREEEEKRKEDQRKRDEEERIRKEAEEKKKAEEAKERALWLIEKGKESESVGKYQEALNYYREADKKSIYVSAKDLIREVERKIKEEEEKERKRHEEERRLAVERKRAEEAEIRMRKEAKRSRERVKVVSVVAAIVLLVCIIGYITFKPRTTSTPVVAIAPEQQSTSTPAPEEKVSTSSQAEKLKTEEEKIEEFKMEALKAKDEMDGAKKRINIELARQYATREYQFSVSQEGNGIKDFESGNYKEAKEYFEIARAKYLELPDIIVKFERAGKEALKAKDELESAKKRIDTQLTQRYVGREYNELISQEKKGMEAFESGRFKEAKDIFEAIRIKYSELPDRIARLKKSEEDKAAKERFEKLRLETEKAKSKMESAKNKVDMKLVEKFGFKQEYNMLLSQESKGKEAFEANQYKEAKNIFEKVEGEYAALADKAIGLKKDEEDRFEKERTERLRQEAVRSKDDAERTKLKIEMRMVEKYGFREEYKLAVNQEEQGKKAISAGKYQDAIEYFLGAKKGFDQLVKENMSSRFSLEITPSVLNFGSVSPSTSSNMPTQRLNLTNKGSAVIRWRSKIEGRDSYMFTFQYGIAPREYYCRNYIEPGKSCIIDIAFSSWYARYDLIQCNLSIVLDDPNSTTYNIPLSGQVIQPPAQDRSRRYYSPSRR